MRDQGKWPSIFRRELPPTMPSSPCRWRKTSLELSNSWIFIDFCVWGFVSQSKAGSFFFPTVVSTSTCLPFSHPSRPLFRIKTQVFSYGVFQSHLSSSSSPFVSSSGESSKLRFRLSRWNRIHRSSIFFTSDPIKPFHSETSLHQASHGIRSGPIMW